MTQLLYTVRGVFEHFSRRKKYINRANGLGNTNSTIVELKIPKIQLRYKICNLTLSKRKLAFVG